VHIQRGHGYHCHMSASADSICRYLREKRGAQNHRRTRLLDSLLVGISLGANSIAKGILKESMQLLLHQQSLCPYMSTCRQAVPALPVCVSNVFLLSMVSFPRCGLLSIVHTVPTDVDYHPNFL
jgi:hypothetical protein